MDSTIKSHYEHINIMSSDPDACNTIYFNQPNDRDSIYTPMEIILGLSRMKCLDAIRGIDNSNETVADIDILLWEGEWDAITTYLKDTGYIPYTDQEKHLAYTELAFHCNAII